MRVTYDISKLASDWSSQRRTGIGRVVEHLALELCAIPECEISFSCMVTNFLRHARKGLRESPQLSGIPLPVSVPRRALRLASERSQSVLAHSPSLLRPVSSPVERLLSHVDNTWGLAAHPIEPHVLEQAHVFHSPMHPLPEMKIKRKPQRFINVHDLIPLRYPEYFQVENRTAVESLIHNIVCSAGPEDWVICHSHATLNDLCEYRGHEIKRSVIISLAAHPLLFHNDSSEESIATARRKYQIPNDAYFLSVCKLEPRKNVAHTVRSFLQMVSQQRLKDVTFVIAGTPAWGIEEIDEAIASCPDPEYRNQVLRVGHIADEDLAPLYKGSTGFLYMSHVEGFGLPPLEAMQCGAPVIVSDRSSLPEVVGDAGALLSPQDVDGLAQTLLNLYNSSSLRKEYSEKSLARARLFSWERSGQETVAAYRRALNEASSTSAF